MGLDMYLKGKRYISSYFNEGDSEKAAKIAELFPEVSGLEIKEVMVEAGYWRKANAIHKWFVDNVQEGEDDCGNYYVGREQLAELRELCQKVLADRSLAAEMLPPQSGFFFGGTDIDDWYFRDLEQTVKIIDNALTMPESWDFEYTSSW
jgi:hypothetical protein